MAAPDSMGVLSAAFSDHENAMASVFLQRAMIQKMAAVCLASLDKGGTIYFVGNGGSAADAQHLAAELVGRFKRDRGPYAAVALTTDTSVLTAIGNDYGFCAVFERQVQALMCPLDVLVCLSTSGNSENILHAAGAAHRNESTVLTLTGKHGGALGKVGDYGICIASNDSARIQECHIFIGHCICELIEGVK